jgi:hypothetical protein
LRPDVQEAAVVDPGDAAAALPSTMSPPAASSDGRNVSADIITTCDFRMKSLIRLARRVAHVEGNDMAAVQRFAEIAAA